MELSLYHNIIIITIIIIVFSIGQWKRVWIMTSTDTLTLVPLVHSAIHILTALYCIYIYYTDRRQ